MQDRIQPQQSAAETAVAHREPVSDKNPVQSKAGKKPPIQAKQRPIQRLAKSKPIPGKHSPIQRKSKAGQIAQQMGEQHGVDTSGLEFRHNSAFPASVGAEATIQGNKIDFAPGKDSVQNIKHEVGHAIDNAKNGTPKGDKVVNGQMVDTTREAAADKMMNAPLQRKEGESLTNQITPAGESSVVQRTLTYYDKDGEEKLFETFAEVFEQLEQLAKREVDRVQLKKFIDKRLAEDGIQFNFRFADEIVNDPPSGQEYLFGHEGREFLISFIDVYKEGVKHWVNDESILTDDAYNALKSTYEETEADDGQEVEDDYKSGLACTLFALLAVKGTIWGASTPQELHEILRAMPKLRVYDEDEIVGFLRMKASLNYTNRNSIKVADFVASLGEEDQTRKFIVDLDGEPHTFALKHKDGEWKRFDNGSETGYIDGATIGKYNSSKISVTWE
ncbi:hypothetical protein BKI52_19825 [marine bacterium AO1-C]|nr:hypothetical protein BKI52_19825 [marine bacterium AO1-C]